MNTEQMGGEATEEQTQENTDSGVNETTEESTNVQEATQESGSQENAEIAGGGSAVAAEPASEGEADQSNENAEDQTENLGSEAITSEEVTDEPDAGTGEDVTDSDIGIGTGEGEATGGNSETGSGDAGGDTTEADSGTETNEIAAEASFEGMNFAQANDYLNDNPGSMVARHGWSNKHLMLRMEEGGALGLYNDVRERSEAYSASEIDINADDWTVIVETDSVEGSSIDDDSAGEPA